MYLWDTLWPSHLSVHYPYEAGEHWGAWRLTLSAFVLVAFTVAVLYRRQSHPFLLVGWLWFMGNLVPVIGLVQVGDQGRADRYVYLPLVGIFVMLVWGMSEHFRAAHQFS